MSLDPFSAGFDLVKTALDKFLPDANEKLKGQIAEEAQKAGAELQALIGQLEINKQEAAHPSVFVAGWRPFIGWVGGLGIGYQVLFMPIGNGLAAMFGLPPVFPGTDISLLQSLVGGMLGLGIARSWDKKNGADTKVLASAKDEKKGAR